jgi:hypothetical protein
MALLSDLRAAYNQKYGPGAAKGISEHDLRANYNTMYGAGAAAQLKAGIKPTQPAQGLLSPPPAVSTPAAPPPAVSTPEPAPQALPALTQPQNEVINNIQEGDLQLGDTANQMLPQVNQSFEQPFDWGKYEAMAPVQGDYNNWVNQQMQNYNSAFDSRMNPVFSQQTESFEQKMANRGIPMGSELYNREKSRMEQAQNDARTQAYAANQGQAIQGARSLFDVGSQAQQNALGLGQAARYGSLNDYSALRGAQSGMAGQNLGFSQGMQMQQGGFDFQKAMQEGLFGQQRTLAEQGFDWQKQLQEQQNKAAMQQLKYATKNRGGGGPAPTAWERAGFGSYQDMAAFEEAQRRDSQLWNWQNAPQQDGGPSPGYQLGGSILGTGLGILGGMAMNGKLW